MAAVLFPKREVVLSQPWIEISHRNLVSKYIFHLLKRMQSLALNKEVAFGLYGWYDVITPPAIVWFWEESLVGGDSFYLKFWVNRPRWSEINDFEPIFARSASPFHQPFFVSSTIENIKKDDITSQHSNILAMVCTSNIIFCDFCCFKSASWQMSSVKGIVNCWVFLQ